MEQEPCNVLMCTCFPPLSGACTRPCAAGCACVVCLRTGSRRRDVRVVGRQYTARNITDLSCLLFVTFPDIFVYCVLRTGMYGADEMKAYRSLEAFNYFESGFVQEMLTHKVQEGARTVIFVKASVLPNQRVGQKAQPYVAWALCEATGTILTGHCTCMAG